MAKKKGRGTHKSRNKPISFLDWSLSLDPAVLAQHTALAKYFFGEYYGVRTSADMWITYTLPNGCWLSCPLDDSTYLLKHPVYVIEHELSPEATGFVCSMMAWASLVQNAEDPKLEFFYEESLARLNAIIADHPERNAIYSLLVGEGNYPQS